VDITLSDADIAKADVFLSTFLSENVVDGDFSPGSALRDFAVKSISLIFAFLEAERAAAKAQSSLLVLAKLPPSADVDAAVDAYLSNLFLTRKTGSPTHLPVLLHFSAATDVILSSSIRFFRTSSLVFTPDTSGQTVIPASSLRLTTSTDGSQDFTCAVNLVSAGKNSSYNVEPGRFVQVDRFNPFFTYAENLESGVDGKGPETTAGLLERAPTALSTRNLVNQRSIEQVLFENFPTLTQALAVGMGEPEMKRDLVQERVTGLVLHAGGHTDIYVGLPRTSVTESGLLAGGSFPRADGRISILRDPALGSSAFAGVSAGNVLVVISGLGVPPRQSLIVRATPAELEVATPFRLATDELATTVSYTVGSLGPDFKNLIGASSPRTAGVTSRSEATQACVYLQGRPVYRVNQVSWISGSSLTAISNRVNHVPRNVNEYTVEVLNSSTGQSEDAVTRVRLHDSLDGTEVSVTYDTLAGYDAIATHVTGPFDRVLNANHLVRGYNPAYVSAKIPYTRRYGAQTSYDRSALAAAVAAFVNGFDWRNVLAFSSFSDFLTKTFTDIGVVYPFTLGYTLFAPDGQVLVYESRDIATLFPGPENTAALLNGEELRTPLATPNDGSLRNFLAELGVTDRTVRYLANPSDFYVWERDVEPPPG
jgi:hypothetical protein